MIYILLIIIIALMLFLLIENHLRLKEIENKIIWIARVLYPTQYIFNEVGFSIGAELRDFRNDAALIFYQPLSDEAKEIESVEKDNRYYFSEAKNKMHVTQYSELKGFLKTKRPLSEYKPGSNLLREIEDWACNAFVYERICEWKKQFALVSLDLHLGKITLDQGIEILKKYHCSAVLAFNHKDEERCLEIYNNYINCTYSLDNLKKMVSDLESEAN